MEVLYPGRRNTTHEWSVWQIMRYISGLASLEWWFMTVRIVHQWSRHWYESSDIFFSQLPTCSPREEGGWRDFPYLIFQKDSHSREGGCSRSTSHRASGGISLTCARPWSSQPQSHASMASLLNVFLEQELQNRQLFQRGLDIERTRACEWLAIKIKICLEPVIAVLGTLKWRGQVKDVLNWDCSI